MKYRKDHMKKKIILSGFFYMTLSAWASNSMSESADSAQNFTDQDARKQAMSCSEEVSSDNKGYPQIKFSDTELTAFTTSTMAFEFSNQGKDYAAYCYKWPEGEPKPGISESCKGWCLVPKPEGAWTASLMMWHTYKAVGKCKSCETDPSLCKGVSLLKNGSDIFTFSTLSGSKNVMQMSNEGKLLVFQIGVNGEKDISKPYLSFGRTSELVEIKTRPNKEPRKEYINKSSLTLQKAKASVTIVNTRMPSDDPTDGERLCKEISLNSTECKTLTELPNYECVKANVTSSTTQKKKIESKLGVH